MAFVTAAKTHGYRKERELPPGLWKMAVHKHLLRVPSSLDSLSLQRIRTFAYLERFITDYPKLRVESGPGAIYIVYLSLRHASRCAQQRPSGVRARLHSGSLSHTLFGLLQNLAQPQKSSHPQKLVSAHISLLLLIRHSLLISLTWISRHTSTPPPIRRPGRSMPGTPRRVGNQRGSENALATTTGVLMRPVERRSS